MDQSKGLSALGYLSFYFAPFILPLIIFFVTKEEFVKHHCKRAFLSQLIPIILGIFLVIYFFFSVFSWNEPMGDPNFLTGSFLIAFVLLLLVSAVLAIWNLVQAIKVLR